MPFLVLDVRVDELDLRLWTPFGVEYLTELGDGYLMSYLLAQLFNRLSKSVFAISVRVYVGK
jgi:hypothetical protein